jgi:hypothetical protein
MNCSLLPHANVTPQNAPELAIPHVSEMYQPLVRKIIPRMTATMASCTNAMKDLQCFPRLRPARDVIQADNMFGDLSRCDDDQEKWNWGAGDVGMACGDECDRAHCSSLEARRSTVMSRNAGSLKGSVSRSSSRWRKRLLLENYVVISTRRMGLVEVAPRFLGRPVPRV